LAQRRHGHHVAAIYGQNNSAKWRRKSALRGDVADAFTAGHDRGEDCRDWVDKSAWQLVGPVSVPSEEAPNRQRRVGHWIGGAIPWPRRRPPGSDLGMVRTWAWFGPGHGSDMGMVSPSRVRCRVSHSVSAQRVSPACQSSVPAQWVGPVGGPRVHLVRPRLGRNQKGQWPREPQAASGCMAIMAIADETAAPRLRRGAPARGPPAKRRTA
jgi:hypothetical protein